MPTATAFTAPAPLAKRNLSSVLMPCTPLASSPNTLFPSSYEVMSSTLLAVPFVATAAAPIVFAAALALTTLDAS